MILGEAKGVSDEGYTSSPSASLSSLIVSPSGTAPQWPLAESPRLEGIEVVSVTPVDPAARNAAQIERKQRKKGGGSRDRKKRWRGQSDEGLSFESHGQVTAYNHRNVRIPPLPKRYSLMALNKKFFKNPPPMPPQLSEEEKNANLIESLRDEVTTQRAPLIPPKKLPSKVQFLGFTEKGTVMTIFLDEENQSRFKRNRDRIAMLFGQKKIFKVDTRIQKEDVFKGRVVLASVPRRNGSLWNIRAVISDFNDGGIIVDGVDYAITQRKLSYDNVFYMWKEVNFSPFQLQEVHLEGLENYEGHPAMRLIIRKVIGALNVWARKEGQVYPDYLILKKIKKGREGYKVRLEFPEEFLDGLSLNEVMLEGWKNFDPFVDYMVTP